MTTQSFAFLFRQERIGTNANAMDEFIVNGKELSDTARNALTSMGALNTALAGVLTTQGLGATTTAGAFQVGKLYEIVSVGTTNYTLIGASANTIGVVFRATGAGAGTGTVKGAQEVNNIKGTGRIVRNIAKVFTGTGNGTMAQQVVDTAVEEIWNVVATSATNFTVTGTVSGAKANATVGVPYDNGILAFKITAGSTPFTAGAKFELTVSKVAALDGVYRDGTKVVTSLTAVQTALVDVLKELTLLTP